MLNHPVYIFLLFLSFFLIVKVILTIVHENPHLDDSEEDGGVTTEDPVLDLPPGVGLPEDDKKVLI